MYFFPILGDSPRNGHSREGFNACDSVVSPRENDTEDIDEGTKNQRHRYSIQRQHLGKGAGRGGGCWEDVKLLWDW